MYNSDITDKIFKTYDDVTEDFVLSMDLAVDDNISAIYEG